MTYADFIRYQIESKPNVILSVALKIDKVSTAELPVAIKYLLLVIQWGYKDETSTLKEIFQKQVNKW